MKNSPIDELENDAFSTYYSSILSASYSEPEFYILGDTQVYEEGWRLPDFLFQHPERVMIIWAENCGLSKLDPRISQLINLASLELDNTELSELSEEIISLKNLRHLNLNRCRLKIFPEELLQLPTLRFLSVSSNQIPEIPQSIHKIEELRELDISENPIAQIPKNLSQLKYLHTLKLGNRTHTNYSKYFLVFPEVILDCEKIINLNIGGLFETIPEEISNLYNLMSLNLGYNRNIKEIPKSIGSLIFLKYLDLKYNQLTELPDSMIRLKHLTSLDIQGNVFRHFPEPLLVLPCLKELSLDEAIFEPSILTKSCSLNTLRQITINLEPQIHQNGKNFSEVSYDSISKIRQRYLDKLDQAKTYLPETIEIYPCEKSL